MMLLKRKYYTMYLVGVIIIGALVWMFISAGYIMHNVNKKSSAHILKENRSK